MKKLCLILLVIITLNENAFAQLKMPAIFSDNMVLQQRTDVAFWGNAKPGEQVEVKGSWSEKSIRVKADMQGKWLLKLPTPGAGGPFTVTVEAAETKKFKNVLIGEVWICSGQSNMEMPMQGWPNQPVDGSLEAIKGANYPSIRLFTVEKKVAFSPQTALKGTWLVCSPNSVAAFSATAYYFGRQLHERLKVPIGLIHSSWGGTIAEAWTGKEALQTMGDFDKELNRIDSINRFASAVLSRDSLNEAIWSRALTDRKDTYAKDNTYLNWPLMEVPAFWENKGLADFDGIVWFKRSVDIPQAWKGKPLKLSLGLIDDFDYTYFNGELIDSTVKGLTWIMDREYTIPGELVKEGSNTITVKIIDNGGNGGMYGKKEQMILYPADGKKAEGIRLSGDWRYKVAATKPKVMMDEQPNQPSVLYNGMLAPLIPYAIRGAIWYQGESNVGRAKQYLTLFPLMINNWREAWGRGDFPFYFVQIAPFKYAGDAIDAAALRDAQRRTLKKVAGTGMAITLDIGNPHNIHPANKEEVGKRLALWALNKTYQEKTVIYSGPVYKGFKVKKRKVLVYFENTSGKLDSKNKALTNFELLDGDGEWKPAVGEIEGDIVVVVSDQVDAPKGVRYAYYDAAQASLFGSNGLPASSFSSEPLD
ncbi:sialate O-acetylesterase [Olivibacter sp. CPCC 100613]|uniref:sialate O-acetylesterase n=1 Tax=Olivibacter sp. CPCC 100613 TaxID=3079931 RepID=UPI002FFBCC82